MLFPTPGARPNTAKPPRLDAEVPVDGLELIVGGYLQVSTSQDFKPELRCPVDFHGKKRGASFSGCLTLKGTLPQKKEKRAPPGNRGEGE